MYVGAIPPFHVRRATTLLFEFDASALRVKNFLSSTELDVDLLDMAILSATAGWRSLSGLVEEYRGSWYEVTTRIQRLCRHAILIVEGSRESANDERYAREWSWGSIAGYYHFGMKDPVYASPGQAASWLHERLQTKAPVELFWQHSPDDQSVELPRSELKSSFFEVLRARRSARGFSEEQPLALSQLSDCLFAGFGITGFMNSGLIGHPWVPATLSPSAGGRNPFDGYLVAPRVAGLTPGVYRYSGFDHSLTFIGPISFSVGELLGGQQWFDAAPAVIFLVANFQRTMWKYPHHTGHRVILIEAGHIAQNILLACASEQLCSAPTCALSDALCTDILKLDLINQSAVYAIAVGVRGNLRSIADPTATIEHELT